MTRKYKAIRIAALIAAVMLMTAMWFFSSQTGEESGRLSGAVTRFLLKLVRLEPTPARLDRLGYIVRKAAHFNLFLCLGLALGVAAGSPRKPFRALWAVPAAALCALGDEAHQHFVAARAAMWQDCLLDSCGALTGAALALGIWALAARRRSKRTKSKKPIQNQ